MKSDDTTGGPITIGLQFQVNLTDLASVTQEERELVIARFMLETSIKVEEAIRLEFTAWVASQS